MKFENILLSLFFFIYIIEAIIQIFLLNRFIKKHVEKYWYEFLGITIIIFLFDILTYTIFAYHSSGLTYYNKWGGISIFILCCNFILWISGLIIKKRTKQLNDVNDKRIRKVPFSIIILICNVIVLFMAIQSKDKISIMTYLEQKYGDGNYKVVNISKEYSYDGIIRKYVSSYDYEIESDYMDGTFIIRIGELFPCIEADYFLPVYYSEKYNLDYELYYDDVDDRIHYDFDELEEYMKNNIKVKIEEFETEKVEIGDICTNYVQSWSNMDGIEYNPNYFIILENCGRILSMDELLNLLIEYYN